MKHCFLLVVLSLAGCAHGPLILEPTVGRYHNPAFAWRGVARLVILPLVNETTYPQAADEMRRSLHAELQQMGLFESVPAPAELTEAVSRRVRDSGRFSEADMVALARCGGADVILVGTLAHYSPYQRPRIGLTLQAISPDLGQVAASVDGLWDSTEHDVAERARLYYARILTHKQRLHDYAFGRWENSYGSDLVLESPHLFQRFVSYEAVHLLVGQPLGRSGPPQAPPVWAPGSVLLTVKSFLEQLCGTKPCPKPTDQKPPADNAAAPAANKPENAKDTPDAPPPVPREPPGGLTPPGASQATGP